MPETGTAFISGWATSSSVTNRAQEAHYFDDKGLSLCARWTATILDRPATPGARRCSACMDKHSRTWWRS